MTYLYRITMRKILLASIYVLISTAVYTQTCTNLGQNPSTAFPVCGSSVFKQTSVDICGTRQIPTPCTGSGALFQDKNPYWYKFTCFTTGTLGFEIVPSNLSDDYDWQLFDITLTNPNDVYTNKSLFVACNWSGEGGKTGANATGTSLSVCDGYGRPLYSKMPDLEVGHEYLLLISHFTNSQSGYSLSFGGGTASITDSTASSIASAKPACDGKTISVKLNKKMRCNSLAPNGSDFFLSTSTIKIISANGINCNNAFDMDSIVLVLDQPLSPGNYSIKTQNGNDGNTLLDYCQNSMAEGIADAFVITSLQPTPFDSITSPGCKPNQVKVVFRKPILCASVASDGSDFAINTPGIAITQAASTCANNTTYEIFLTLSTTITSKGTYAVRLKKGTDGNTILDECLQETPAGSTVSFATADTVSAAINYAISYSCKADTLHATNVGTNGINQWMWKFNDRASSTQQSPAYVYTQFGAQQVSLTVSNGVCSDSSRVNFVLDNELKANFIAPTLLCPQDPAVFRDTSVGKIVSWLWDFGNGTTSTLKNPLPQMYAAPVRTTTYTLKLTVRNNSNCVDTLSKFMRVINNCFIAVASAFTPNGDGLNDFLYPINAFKANNLLFAVYNRYGQLVFKTTDTNHKWDGTFKGLPQATGTYVWTLQYVHADTGEAVNKKGTSVLLR